MRRKDTQGIMDGKAETQRKLRNNRSLYVIYCQKNGERGRGKSG